MPEKVAASRPVRQDTRARRVLGHSAETWAPADARAHIRAGTIQTACWTYSDQQARTLTPTDGLVCIVLALRGGGVAQSGRGAYCVNEGEALLLARTEAVNYVMPAGSAGVVIHIPRPLLQAAASRIFDEPQRLAPSELLFAWSDRPAFLSGPSFNLLDSDARTPAGPALERALSESLVRALDAAGLRDAGFSTAKSVARALSLVQSSPSSAWTIEDLAQGAGVTAATLRRNFRACLNLTVTDVVRDARLHWVRQRLASAHESRSIAQLSAASGFKAATGLARAYQRRFGETPTQTRARTFAPGKERRS